jgi:hypothetical protein
VRRAPQSERTTAGQGSGQALGWPNVEAQVLKDSMSNCEGEVSRQVGGKPKGLLEATARHAVKVQRFTNAASPVPVTYPFKGELALRRYGDDDALPLIRGNDSEQVRRQWPQRCVGVGFEPCVPLRRFIRMPASPWSGSAGRRRSARS